MGQFEGDDYREIKGVIFVEIVVCLVEFEGGESRERERELGRFQDFCIWLYLLSNLAYFKE